MSSKIYIVGMGPGTGEMMTPQADHALCGSDVIVGYPVYLKLLGGKYRKKEFLSTPMKQEVRRCEMCFEEAEKGKTVAMVCSGDAGVYGMASLLYEMSEAHPGCELEVIPGITAANSGAAALGAPLNHDYCVISLSELMTPWELIEKRLAAAAVGAMTMAAGIMAAMPGVAQLSPVYLAAMVCAINGGATAFSHVNDSGFWLVSSLVEMDEKTTLNRGRSWKPSLA